MPAPVQRHSTRSYRSRIPGFELLLHCGCDTAAVEGILELVVARTVLDRLEGVPPCNVWVDVDGTKQVNNRRDQSASFPRNRPVEICCLVNLLSTPVAGERGWMKRWMDRKEGGCVDGNEMDGKTQRVESLCGTVKICTPIGCWVLFRPRR